MALPALLGAASALGSTMLGNMANQSLNEETRDWNEKMWRMNNEYNTPANQMKRLRAAGVNPHFAISGGSVGPGSSTSPVSPTSPTPYDFSPISEGVSRSVELYQQKRVQDADIDLKNSQAENQRLRNITQLWRDYEDIQQMISKSDVNNEQKEVLKAQANEIWTNIQSLAERNEEEIQKIRSERYLNNALERKERLLADFQSIVNTYEVSNREKVLRNLDAQYQNILAAAAAGNASAAASYAEVALKGVETSTAKKIQKSVVDKAFQEVESIKDDRELKWLRAGFDFWGDLKRAGNTEARERVGEGYFRAKKQSRR